MRKKSYSKNLGFEKIITNVSCIISETLADVVHSGIAIYDPFLIEDGIIFRSSTASEPLDNDAKAQKKVFFDNFASESKRKYVKPSKSLLDLNVSVGGLKRTASEGQKKVKASNKNWYSNQLIKVYGKRYERTVKNSCSLLRSPKKQRGSSVTPTNFKKSKITLEKCISNGIIVK